MDHRAELGEERSDRLASVARTAKIRPLKFKNLRDTYASTLCSHGIVLRWISKQLGHGSVSVTERHYASFLATEGDQNPWIVPEGMLAELESRVPQDSPPAPPNRGGRIKDV